MGAFELPNAKKKSLDSGVAPQTPIALYPIGQQRCLWIPKMGIFELHNAKKNSQRSGLAPQTPIVPYSIGQQSCCWIPRMGVFELHTAIKNIVWVLGWRHNHPYLCASKHIFGYLCRGCLDCTLPKKLFVFWGGAPNTRTSVPKRPAKVLLDTYDGGV